MMDSKIAVVTGAGKGIGKAIAKAFAGENIFPVIVDINEQAAKSTVSEIEKGGNIADYIISDISKVNNIKTLVSEISTTYNRIDILVNNAGILSKASLDNLEEDEWDKVFDINLKSAVFLMKYVIPAMKKNNWGRIINISSLAGRMGGISTGCAYSASKAGLLGLSMCVARKVAEFGITVNSIAPGTTDTELAKGFSDDEMKKITAGIPIGKLIQPTGIAKAVCFLASDLAEYITGAVLDVNGGMFMSS